MKRLLIIAVLFAATACKQNKPEALVVNNTVNVQTDTAFIQTVTFPSLDSLTVTATIYHAGKNLPLMVLCHKPIIAVASIKKQLLCLTNWATIV